MAYSRPQSKNSNWKSRSLWTGTSLAVVVGLSWAATSWGGSSSDLNLVPTSDVRLMDLRDTVIEQGEIESQSIVTGVCEIESYENKVIFLVPEGEVVTKGQVVCKFDTSKFTEHISQSETAVNSSENSVENAKQEVVVKKDENESAIRAAKQAMEFAELDLDKYENGDYVVNRSDLEGAISESKTELDKALREMVNMRALVKRGFREYEQLRQSEQVVTSRKLRLKRDRQKLLTLDTFEHKKTLREFRGKLEEAKHKFSVSQSTAKAKNSKAKEQLKNAELGLTILKRRLEKLKESLEKHVMVAPQNGTITFPRVWQGNGKVRKGSTIYQSQPVFILPDMSRMQVKVGVHESLISKVKPNQKAIVRIDAFSGCTLRGVVKSVSPLSASTPWEASNNYHVIVTIDEMPDEVKLKPGMTAEVEILVGQYPNVLAVPIQSLASFGRKKYVFVKDENSRFEKHEVSIGKSNISFVEITSGLQKDEVVALDSYQRAVIEFGDQEPELDDESELLVAETEVATDESDVGKTSEEIEPGLPSEPSVEDPAGNSGADVESDLPPKPIQN